MKILLQGSIIIDQKLFYSALGDSMGSLIGLKNMLIFSAVLLAIGSVSAQEAFAGFPGCLTIGDGDWNDPDNWENCGGSTPDSSDDIFILENHNVQLDGVGEARGMSIFSNSLLFIGCDGDLTVQQRIFVQPKASLINHGSVDMDGLTINFDGLVQNSSSDFTFNSISGPGTFENISTICSQPIGGTVGSLDTATLLVAGAQANMGLWSLALVGMVAAGAAIIYKTKSKKTEK